MKIFVINTYKQPYLQRSAKLLTDVIITLSFNIKIKLIIDELRWFLTLK